ncbi:hypothetical protein [Maribacter aurantiacus]|uniref:Uncharacterized protein n=1 Tax=Maribacter aurantiacus TaxID=1882343 RepID=A0A5R8MA66_9FLAO|nr:hypothetical protein [Maribacter aurantiacus]TLF46400.1 hypothetical protein FEK29_01065 [Maribacter aurantiacus]
MKYENRKSKELEKQERTIRKSLAIVFIPIFLMIISIALIQQNSLSYLEKEYYKCHNDSYSGNITSLLLERTKGRTRPILIDNKWEKEVPFFIHEKLTVGDSLFKEPESDFDYFVLISKTDTIKRDLNKLLRKKYFEKLNKK